MTLSNILTNKQIKVLQSYLHDDWKYLILSGAVRSGKTYIDNYLFILELRRVAKLAAKRHDPKPQFILAGFSSNTIYNNVISSLSSQFGVDLTPDKHGHYHLFGVDIVPAYTGSIRGMSGIRGMTSYGAYINEASLAVHEVFQEILDRCSVEGARVICDTNPDNPQHFLKTDYIDNHKPEARIKTFSFVLDDNPTLSRDYVDALKAATPSGVFYDRRILGQWVSGDGIVYRDFDKRTMMIDKQDLPDDLSYYCGVDWGFEHAGVITVFGDDRQGNVYLIEEHTKQFKFIEYWKNIAKDIQAKYGRNILFWCDSARPDNVSEFQQAGIQARNANKAKMAGIEKVSEYMKQGKFFVVKEGVDQFLDEVYQYVWDDKTGEPVKENDHVMDSMRYAVFNQHRDNQARTIRSRYF